ncbi:short-chain dehydrogenase [Microbacterium faecale]|uniref:Short-chain dehydrogenase n=1 Tax=Microbacterium faecale TaxID=1804630 RepID=A0A916Y213_9MICO|nr:SDR family oxidoreductase [Microbacterium faecale]GGD27324.1 short-chain dehydrogenase [Microbacterium faecale]
MQITDSIALVTGANRGIGAEFVRQLAERGARKVYATARSAQSITATGVEVIELDITDEEAIAQAAAAASDVTLLINNAGVASGADLLTGAMSAIRRDMETNLFGTLALSRAFAPVLRRNGGGAILNVLSAASWYTAVGAGAYAMSKAAAWSLTDATRHELAAQGTQVVGLHMAMVDTEMTASMDVPKISRHDAVAAALDGIEAGADEVIADDVTRAVKSALDLAPTARYAA